MILSIIALCVSLIALSISIFVFLSVSGKLKMTVNFVDDELKKIEGDINKVRKFFGKKT
jgi:hypothetical protein